MSNTIQAVQNNGTYEGSYGTMYKQEVTLDDGSTGEVSAKSEGKWKVGDVVEVQRTETKFGTRFKFSIPQEGGARPNGFSGSSFKQDPETQLRIEASWAIGQAVAMGVKSHKELVKSGLTLIDARNALIQALKDVQQAKQPKPAKKVQQPKEEYRSEEEDKPWLVGQKQPWEDSIGDVPNVF